MTSALSFHHSMSFFSNDRAKLSAASSVTLKGEERKDSPFISEETSTMKPKGVSSSTSPMVAGEEKKEEVRL